MEDGLTEEQYRFPIWLVADSYPGDFVGRLQRPLDPRHPTRHTIWTPIWDVIQETVYPGRVDGTYLFICNAAERQPVGEEPNRDLSDSAVQNRIAKFSDYLRRYKPVMVVCFGGRAFEFVRRANDPNAPQHSVGHWSIQALGEAFRESRIHFHPSRTTIFPFLHQIIALQYANGRFVPDHSEDNYFSYVGKEIGRLLSTHADGMSVIWKQ